MLINKILQFFSNNPSYYKLESMKSLVNQINHYEKSFQKLSDEELRTKSKMLQMRARDGENLNNLLSESYAIIKNVCRRLWGQKFIVCGIEMEWDMIPYDEQILAGIVLYRHGIAEMATGEGKSLSAAMPLYLHALCGKGCHLVTVNDYLAQRDAEWIGNIFRFLNLSVGCLVHDQSPLERRIAYQCDITYGTNSEFGFDYLRDNGIAQSMNEQVQRGHYYAIIDEIDSILIDEARTPLIISGEQIEDLNILTSLKPMIQQLLVAQQNFINQIILEVETLNSSWNSTEASRKQYLRKLLQIRMGMPHHRKLAKLLSNSMIRKELDEFDSEIHSSLSVTQLQQIKEELYFSIDEKFNQVEMSSKGFSLLSHHKHHLFVLPDINQQIQQIRENAKLSIVQKDQKIQECQSLYQTHVNLLHSLSQLLKAYCLFERDIHYMVQNGKIILIDEHTGRAMEGRRFSDGLHQALEVKEGVPVESENRTYASITQQNYFRLYQNLAGMTGTAMTEANEFYNIYKLEVTQIPTHRPVCRINHCDKVFRTRREKFNAIIHDVLKIHQTGQPILLGTPSIEDSETLSRLLRQRQIKHQLLNAKQPQYEATVIAQAGQKGMITVATNMAGRGTDIQLGPEVAELGGLYVIGSARHDARRIDLQLQGRCSRQGDKGQTQFYISLEDSFMRLFGPEKIVRDFAKNEIKEGGYLSHPELDRLIERAQHKLEMQHFSMRKHVLDYDDVMNLHRKIIYDCRNQVITDSDMQTLLYKFLREGIFYVMEIAQQPRIKDDFIDDSFDWIYFKTQIETVAGIQLNSLGITENTIKKSQNLNIVNQQIVDAIMKIHCNEIALFPVNFQKSIVRTLLLHVIDSKWIQHLDVMERLRENIGFSSYAQKDPLIEYKKAAYTLFKQLLQEISHGVMSTLLLEHNNHLDSFSYE